VSTSRWLGVRLDLVSAIVVLVATLFAVTGRESVSSAVLGLAVVYAIDVSNPNMYTTSQFGIIIIIIIITSSSRITHIF
jgi:hypothetical protein